MIYHRNGTDPLKFQKSGSYFSRTCSSQHLQYFQHIADFSKMLENIYHEVSLSKLKCTRDTAE